MLFPSRMAPTKRRVCACFSYEIQPMLLQFILCLLDNKESIEGYIPEKKFSTKTKIREEYASLV